MKIMCVTRVYPTHRPGGMPFVCQDRARALAAAGHEVHVVTTARRYMPHPTLGGIEDLVGQEASDNGVQLYYVAAPSQVWGKEFAVCCEAMCEHLKPDILHIDSFDRAHPWWVGKAKRVAITMHGFGWGAWQTRWNMHKFGGYALPGPFCYHDIRAESAAMSQADVVIGVSRHEWTMLRDQYGLRQARLVYNPIPDYFFEPVVVNNPSAMSSEALESGAVEEAIQPKRTYFLCAAVSGQVERGFRQAKEACARAGVEFRSVKDVPREQMPAVYDGAKALLLPTSYAQGWDLSVAEARARGVPAIMSSTGSYLQEAEPFDRLVRPLNVEDMVEALKGFEDDRWNWEKQIVVTSAGMGEAGYLVRATAERHWPEAHVRTWLEAVLG